jgi:hypothetical protein
VIPAEFEGTPDLAFTQVVDLTRPWNPYVCIDCNIDTSNTNGIQEYYHVHNFVWCEAIGFDPMVVLDKNGRYHYDYIDEVQNVGMLCLGCLESRLGRKLEPDDFSDAPINFGSKAFERSDRFKNRLGINQPSDQFWLGCDH